MPDNERRCGGPKPPTFSGTHVPKLSSSYDDGSGGVAVMVIIAIVLILHVVLPLAIPLRPGL